MKLTRNFQLDEFLRSETAQRLGTKICPSLENTLNLTYLCAMVLQPLRNHFQEPIRITSGLRNTWVNTVVGGASDSQHLRGEAADIHLPSHERGREYFLYIMEHCTFDQLIWETNHSGSTWIHVSISRLGTNRQQVIDKKL